ncbi:MAG TPA: histidinol-phosphate transaminase [Rhodanobacteraceae bacterium]|nr:histidinol-phosphate transaminase [Rhodanobacteraceae bacterium]
MSAIDLARADIRALKPYSSARMEASGGSVLLNANESPWPSVMGGTGALNRYPDPQPAELVKRLAGLYGVAPSQVLVGRGSDEAIDLLVRAFCRAGQDAVVISPPTFGMYGVSAGIQDATVIEVPLCADFSLDIDGLLARMTGRVKIVFVCSPNNPTGKLVPLAMIGQLAAALTDRALIVVDEAYIEFAGAPSATALLAEYDNVVVLRTLSKAHALAAARIGTLIADADIVALLRRILPAYPLPAPCVEAALAALTPPALAATRVRVEGLLRARERLAEVLKTFSGVREVFPSSANFLLVRCADSNGLYGQLLAAGVVVRDVSHHAALNDCLRITIGSDEDHRRLLAALGLREEAA